MFVEADWEVEIGLGAPLISVLWDGFVDLRNAPDRINEVVEAVSFPALRKALLALNGGGSFREEDKYALVWTSKCDLWSVEDCDPDEMNSQSKDAAVGLACYVDLLPREDLLFVDFENAEAWCREAVHRLRAIDGCNCRVDLVIRHAVAGNAEGLGITAYITGCGSNSAAAHHALGTALESFSSAICN